MVQSVADESRSFGILERYGIEVLERVWVLAVRKVCIGEAKK